MMERPVVTQIFEQITLYKVGPYLLKEMLT